MLNEQVIKKLQTDILGGKQIVSVNAKAYKSLLLELITLSNKTLSKQCITLLLMALYPKEVLTGENAAFFNTMIDSFYQEELDNAQQELIKFRKEFEKTANRQTIINSSEAHGKSPMSDNKSRIIKNAINSIARTKEKLLMFYNEDPTSLEGVIYTIFYNNKPLFVALLLNNLLVPDEPILEESALLALNESVLVQLKEIDRGSVYNDRLANPGEYKSSFEHFENLITEIQVNDNSLPDEAQEQKRKFRERLDSLLNPMYTPSQQQDLSSSSVLGIHKAKSGAEIIGQLTRTKEDRLLGIIGLIRQLEVACKNASLQMNYLDKLNAIYDLIAKSDKEILPELVKYKLKLALASDLKGFSISFVHHLANNTDEKKLEIFQKQLRQVMFFYEKLAPEQNKPRYKEKINKFIMNYVRLLQKREMALDETIKALKEKMEALKQKNANLNEVNEVLQEINNKEAIKINNPDFFKMINSIIHIDEIKHRVGGEITLDTMAKMESSIERDPNDERQSQGVNRSDSDKQTLSNKRVAGGIKVIPTIDLQKIKQNPATTEPSFIEQKSNVTTNPDIGYVKEVKDTKITEIFPVQRKRPPRRPATFNIDAGLKMVEAFDKLSLFNPMPSELMKKAKPPLPARRNVSHNPSNRESATQQLQPSRKSEINVQNDNIISNPGATNEQDGSKRIQNKVEFFNKKVSEPEKKAQLPFSAHKPVLSAQFKQDLNERLAKPSSENASQYPSSTSVSNPNLRNSVRR